MEMVRDLVDRCRVYDAESTILCGRDVW